MYPKYDKLGLTLKNNMSSQEYCDIETYFFRLYLWNINKKQKNTIKCVSQIST